MSGNILDHTYIMKMIWYEITISPIIPEFTKNKNKIKIKEVTVPFPNQTRALYYTPIHKIHVTMTQQHNALFVVFFVFFLFSFVFLEGGKGGNIRIDQRIKKKKKEKQPQVKIACLDHSSWTLSRMESGLGATATKRGVWLPCPWEPTDLTRIWAHSQFPVPTLWLCWVELSAVCGGSGGGGDFLLLLVPYFPGNILEYSIMFLRMFP